MDKRFLSNIGTSFDLDQTTKAYELGGESIYWTDYTFKWFNELPESEQNKHLDNAWDMDKYYKDFDEWWQNLPSSKQEEIYNAIIGVEEDDDYMEVRNNFDNGEGYTTIDAWKTSDPDEEGKVVAVVNNTTKEVFYIEPSARFSKRVQEAINELK